MLDAATANDRLLRVMENYLFYEPLVRLKERSTPASSATSVGTT